MLASIEEVYCIVEDVVKNTLTENVGRKSKLSKSEAITVLIWGHIKHLSTEKQLYEMIQGNLRTCFKNIPSYAQFTRTMRDTLPYLDFMIEVFMSINAQKQQTLCIVDSTALPVSGFNRPPVKWALSSAGKAKNMHGWYQGFKLHIVVNQDREIVGVATTSANVHDVKLLEQANFIKHVNGILVGDKGYIASERCRNLLLNKGIELIAKQRQNMDPYLNFYYSSILKKRRRIESIFGYLKTRLSLIRAFVRTSESFLAHVKAAVIAYMIRFM
jgi:IS5 family transposase